MVKNLKTRRENKDNWKERKAWIGALVVIVALGLGLYFLFENLGKVEYNGMTFIKEKYGDLLVYHYAYYYTNNENELVQYNLYTRVNPAENDITYSGSEISYLQGKFAYLSIDPKMAECADASLGIHSISDFVSGNGITLRSGTTDAEAAIENNLSHITCDTYPDRTTVVLNRGESTEVVGEGLCYTISISKCEDVIVASERFVLQSLIDARRYTSERYGKN